MLKNAFLAVRDKRDAMALAKLAPTSLVFGVWDSRDTQVKLPRLVGSTIRAYKVEKLTRSAQFFAATKKEDTQDIQELPGGQDFLSAVGLNDLPAGRTDGGVIAQGGIRREAVLNLVALRALTGPDTDATRKLQRYVLGLAVVSLLTRAEKFLRQGCLLVPSEGTKAEAQVIDRTGARTATAVTEESALEFAKKAASEFGVGESWTATFDKDAVKKAAQKKKDGKAKKDEKTKKAK